MQLVLVGAAVVSIVAMQDVSTGLVVLGLTVLNAVMGLHQEGKAAESVAALRQMLIMTASVRRDGQLVEIPAEELVPGDIVGFEAGDKVPADGRILVAATLEIEEAGLTGESTPVAKVVDPVAGDDVAARRPDRHGLHELAGHPRPRRDGRDGDGDVDRGRPHLRDAERRRAGEDAAHQAARPADRADHDHGGGGAGADRHPRPRPRRGLRHAVPRSASRLAIAAIPTGLPAVVTMLLSVGTQRARRARARSSSACKSVETLGSTSAICSDKTGHADAQPDDGPPAGRRRPALQRRRRGLLDRRADPARRRRRATTPLEPFMLPMALANDAVIRDGACIGDPTEGALVVLAAKGGLDVEETRRHLPARRRGAVRRRVQADGDVPRDGRRRPARSCAASSRARPTCCSPGRPRYLDADGSPAPMARRDPDAGARRERPARQRGPARARRRAARLRPGDVRPGARPARARRATSSCSPSIGIVDPPRKEAKDAIALVQGRRHPRPDDHRRPRHHGGRDRRPARHRGPGDHRRRVRGDARRAAARASSTTSASSPGSPRRTRCAWSASSSSRATSSP